MRVIAIGIATAAIALAGCSPFGERETPPAPSTPDSASSPTSTNPQDRVITAVLESPHGHKFRMFPDRVGQRRCVIRGGGPYPGLRIRGLCATQVIYIFSSGGAAEVVFTQTWPWRAFHTSGPRRLQKHSWRFLVSGDGDARPNGESGDFPPQYVR